jgi:hypothetical protein
MFHGKEAGKQEPQAVLVDGDLMVYAFDNARANPDNPAPDKKYVFPAHNLTLHQSESSLGPSYSFWLPWDEAGGPQRQISLLTRFEDKSGKIVMSSMAHVTLPGQIARANPSVERASPVANLPAHGGPALPSAFPRGEPVYSANPPPGYGSATWPSNPQVPIAGAFGVQQASFEQPVTAPGQETALGKPRSPMSTVTIDVAPGQARRLLAASNRSTGSQANGQNIRETQLPATNEASTVGMAAGTAARGASARETAPSQQEPPTPDSARGTSPSRTTPATRRTTHDPVRRQPFRGDWPHRLPPTPRFSTTRSEAAPTAEDALSER